jgi:hypothetical protein
MSRPLNDEPTVDWKILLPAPLAGRIEYMLTDPVHNKPIYGARAKLLRALLEHWIAEQTNTEPRPAVPSLMELRTIGDN